MLVVFCKLFQCSDFATKGLQSPAICVTDYISLIETLKATLAPFLDDSDGDFDKVLRLTEELMDKYEIACWDLIMSRERKLPAKFSQSIVTTTFGKTSAIKNNGDLRALWNCILDNEMAELNSRFKDDTYGIMRASAALIPGSTTFGTQELIKSPCSLYGITVCDAEFAFFTQFIKGKADKDKMPSLIELWMPALLIFSPK